MDSFINPRSPCVFFFEKVTLSAARLKKMQCLVDFCIFTRLSCRIHVRRTAGHRDFYIWSYINLSVSVSDLLTKPKNRDLN